ncbi:MAG: phosphoglucomutase/phosphomannomutase family protein [Chloroflexi bacterium]|nr:phosphoglucomutase/phosphomannomutase family protein [Chloroflexota bacterium]MDK1044200.1 phosphoglucomutase/phosphomannomutase family protein [Anaerolineales bacterium]MCH8340817.1 phosphoglucomutase/phosphomannomutase family protein [Chloroflexota bacterium]MCH8876886.1 phosphoglucomutase/phosphomannomutase family protein [Chloroflexota bacterium]MCI0772186.1 phosphoglucomutase/phosphomannomutase family protein [Chloroflexota bacterium]
MPITFGTDGWRGVMSDTFTFYNVRLVSQAIADAVAADELLNGSSQADNPDSRRVVVGFDTRFLSDRFAVEAARVLAGNGIKVFLTSADVPTPCVSFAVRELGAIAGIMITASHNAPRYNGLKLKASYGGAASREQCRRVEFYFNDNESRGRGPNLMDYDQSREAGLIERFNPTPSYHDHLRTLIDFDVIAENPQHVAVDSMYGSGRGQIKGILQGTGCEVTEVRGEMNPGFGGIHPEPIARYLGALAGSIAAGHGQLGLATDGDADRIGAMDGRGEFVNPHRLMSLALKYLVEQRGWSGKIVKTVSTTQMINRLGKKYGLEVIETPVGFDHIADWMLREDVIIGGEESGGISFKGHIPEGDGVLIGLLILEMVAATGSTLEELVDELLKDVGPSHYGRLDLRLTRPVPREQLSSRLISGAPKAIGELKVERVSDQDGVKFHMSDDSWLLVRPSGTEPLLRVYAEAATPENLESLLEYGRQVAGAD